MSNVLAGKGPAELNQIWQQFCAEHEQAAYAAWHEIDLAGVEVPNEADYLRNLICCGWKHLAEEVGA